MQERTELNGQRAELLDWHPERGRFLVLVSGERLLLKAEHLVATEPPHAAWLSSERHLGDLPPDLAQRVATALPARIVAALSAASRALRVALWRCEEARPRPESLEQPQNPSKKPMKTMENHAKPADFEWPSRRSGSGPACCNVATAHKLYSWCARCTRSSRGPTSTAWHAP